MRDPHDPRRAASGFPAGGRPAASLGLGGTAWVLGALMALVPQARALGLGGISGDSEATALVVSPAVDDVGEASLEAAVDQREQAYSLSGAAREAALLEAAGAFGAVADDQSLSLGSRTQGAYRAGELLRARKLSVEAASRFRQALQLGSEVPIPELDGSEFLAPVTEAGGAAKRDGQAKADGRDAREFAARGLLELAHLERRADRVEDALAMYGRLPVEFPDRQRQSAHASTWSTKLLVQLGRLDEAVAATAFFGAQYPDLPLEFVSNAGVVVEGLLDAGRSEAARFLLDSVEDRLQPEIESEDLRVISALESVRVTVMSGAG